MQFRSQYVLVLLLAAGCFSAATTAGASPITVGYVSYDVTGTNVAQFDIYNQSGPNSSTYPDPTFPVVTSVSLSSLTLTVDYTGGGTETFGSSYFTLSGDGLSFDGTALSTLSGPPSGLFGADAATLTGNFSTTSFTLNDGSMVTVNPSFSATITDSSGLSDGDLALINASPASGPPPPVIPEPPTWVLLGTGTLLGLIFLRRRSVGFGGRKVFGSVMPHSGTVGVAIGLGCLIALFPLRLQAVTAESTVKLNAWTSPSSGASGATFVNVTGSGFPSGAVTAANVSLSLASSCGGSPTPATVNSVTHIIGSADRIQFEIPALLATGTYYVSLDGATSTGNAFASGNCSEVTVTHTTTALAACLPSSSLAVLSGKNVTAYVPNSYWNGGNTGVFVVPIEGARSPATISTANPVNSCSSNSQTGQTICVANNTDVYEITGAALTRTLSSSSNGSASFTGGYCENCGVAINALNNTAVIGMGLSPSPSGSGLQILDLANNTFSAPFPAQDEISENMSVDPNRGLILSPGEDSIYDLFKLTPGTGAITEYANTIGGGDLDSAAEDCTTGIALSTDEFTDQLYITDLTQATFTPPAVGSGSTAGTWTAPGQFVTFPEFYGFSAGTSGISVAAGTTHLGIVTGEFGGVGFGVFQLPATSGTGTPAFVDYVAAAMPNTPDGNAFAAGRDPHTITAYTSPNNGRAYGLMADWYTGSPSYIGVVDLQKLLSAPRTPGTHTVDPSYDLIANGVVRYVAVP
ncbi:MAG: PEP-CTERM sorting domain-containing protein [Acidobacteriaceae bacterium]